jgi:mannose-6-phosphate isomerase-like protein (cupin superfamily)
MHKKTFFVVMTAAITLAAATAGAQQGGRGSAPPVPDLVKDKTMFWPASDIDARWAENERLKRNNSRIFNGPTNISANVRIVAGEDEALIHETTADLWIVTAGTAVARTDGKLAGGQIANATTRPVSKGDVLYVPPGVAHHFTEMKGFRAWLIRFDTLGLVRTGPPPAPEGGAARGRGPAGQPGAARGGRAAAPPVPDLATDRTMFWTAADIDARWAENEKLKRINSRIYNGPANISANVRIVNPGDPAATHEETADLWIVTAGEAIARTDGQIVQENGAPTIRNGQARTVHAGDVLYVPPGVPHHYTDMKGFRAWLIRFDVEGWRQSRSPSQ